MHVDAASLRSRDVYRLMTSLIVPRPIAWVGTRSAQGVDNLAPFSYFMGVSSKPPMVAISVASKRGGVIKDSAANIEATGVLSVSLVSEDLLAPMHRSAEPFPPEVSEFEALGIAAVDCAAVAAPRVAAARVAMECRLHQVVALPTTRLILAEVIAFHLDEGVLAAADPPVVDERALRPVARLGPSGYAGLGSLLSPDAGLASGGGRS